MTDTTEKPVLVETADGIRTVTLNHPRRKNAANAPVWDGLQAAFADAAKDPAVRVLVLTGAGGDFCAGADLSGDRAGVHPLSRMHRINDVAMALHDLPIPTIAKVSGVAVGAGWNLALGCDLVVAERDARFSQIFAKRGLSLDFGGSWLLPRIVGLQQAKRLALLAEIIGAEEAERLGLVTYVVEPGTIDAFVADLATTLAAGAPVALAQSKRMLNENADKTLREALESEARAQTINFAGTDAPAAYEAFLAKREPVFTGGWAAK
ncbi:enoyl-CoA hydratase/isomerase family protein [Pseudonocardia sp. RS010]|uniref:enoyl-CoA hydratase/isomerase family protein n=1 Tax=Pseudonocardia sp. RS010 TaxID=3385979 RepID=UPI0039A1AAF0